MKMKVKKIKGIFKSQSRHPKFQEYKKWLGGDEYQRVYDNYILKSINHDMYLQKLRKSTLLIFDDKRRYINETESIPWDWKSYFYWIRFFYLLSNLLLYLFKFVTNKWMKTKYMLWKNINLITHSLLK